MSGELYEGMYCMTQKRYLGRDISGGFAKLDHSGFPLSMIIRGRKAEG